MVVKSSGSTSEAKPTCTLCGGTLNPDSKLCPRCGSAADKIGRCSQCQAIASIEPNKVLGWVCSVCGSARLVNSDSETAPEVQLALRDATRAHRLSRVATPLATVTTALGVLGLLLALLLRSVFTTSESTTAWLVSLPAFVLFLSALGYAWSSKLRKTRGARLDHAYQQALLRQLTTASHAETPIELAKQLGIEQRRTELMLTQLNVRDDITSEVTEDGQIAYSVRSPTAFMTQPLTERIRVTEMAPTQAESSAADDIHNPDVKTQISSVEKA